MIFIVISFHYIADYMSEHPCYSCPIICEVDHIHLTCKQIKEFQDGMDNKQLGHVPGNILDGRACCPADTVSCRRYSRRYNMVRNKKSSRQEIGGFYLTFVEKK